jgi:GH15 family glucan-1,4-alpha-glucosidase
MEAFGLDGQLERWRRIRAEIHDEVCRRAFNSELGAFTQAYESDLLDASTLLIPQVGFLPPDDTRIQSTIEAIERKLMRNGFVLRYDTAATSDAARRGRFPSL